MTLKTQIVGKDDNAVNVSEGALETIVHDHPPKGETEFLLPFRQFMANAAGATDMLVDGSTTPQLFYIEASPDYDIWIKTLAFTIADAGATMNKFGNITALTNGCDLDWKSNVLGTVAMGTALKSNFDFVQMADFNPAFGTGTASFKASNVFSTSEAYVPQLDFTKSFGFKWGIPLIKGTTDRLCFTINDAVGTVDRFDAIAKGVKL
tara:strand:+ start:107 stop:727 length:621 start_codon:yes stop_codon:yes gene_type:complete